MNGNKSKNTVGEELSDDEGSVPISGNPLTVPAARSRTLMDELRDKLGPKWKADFKPHSGVRKGLTLDRIETIKAQLRRLVPLSTALRAEGFTQEAEAYIYQNKDRHPYKWAFAEFDKALAEGEARAIERLNDPDTSKREADALKWMLERALEKSTYAPKPLTKTVNTNNTVSVTMKLPDRNKKALPAAQLVAEPEPALDAEVVKTLPFVPKKD